MFGILKRCKHNTFMNQSTVVFNRNCVRCKRRIYKLKLFEWLVFKISWFQDFILCEASEAWLKAYSPILPVLLWFAHLSAICHSSGKGISSCPANSSNPFQVSLVCILMTSNAAGIREMTIGCQNSFLALWFVWLLWSYLCIVLLFCWLLGIFY